MSSRALWQSLGREAEMQQREVYAGRYRVGPVLGRGGMGVVHIAHDEQLGRDVALKTMALSARADPVAASRFEREARALAALHHPGVVTVYDYGESDGELFLVMQLVEGGSLEQRLSGHRRLSPARTAELAGGIAAALDALHSRGLVHRDIKPSNVLLEGYEERPVLCDFGLAKPTAVSDGLTSTGETVGTVHYMSPEQLAGDAATPASDVYALGCVLFHCLTGRPPFTGTDVHDVAAAHRSTAVPDVRALVPELPASVQPVLERCLAKDPARRYGSAGAAARGLQAALAEADPSSSDPAAPFTTAVLPTLPPPVEQAPHPGPPQRRRRNGSRSRTAAVLAALVVLAGLGYVAVEVVGLDAPGRAGGDRVADGAQLDPAEQQLASLLSDDFGECSPLERTPGQAAKLNCDRTPDGLSSLHAVQWEGSDAMDQWFRTSYADARGYVSAPCGDFAGGAEARGTGRTSTSTKSGVGDIACYVNANGHAVLLWQVEDRDVSLLAIRDDADAAELFEWWDGSWDTVLRADA